ncbi:xyloglucan endotransglucosylase protein 34 isoform X1 [Physcomitrium patens]|uniref:Xyloglucan endotransglucosylase/hydrolase n=1 Tax=Physcomitrium patens TaxID=3218 RepID=A0A2K1J9J6_PHYPA|nr:probable xyloglucan endotransglucosylase/hydrolase protein 5 isoform X1 [Physcomitrium patens]XP_024398145.1 probable xyloglucan endotransglucosylase/hydrolase protein 5 isoform X1 [Physcomitrium patens]XP_024398146.1 probable xyloglucan endotransglucosylase/hydrolase protein 5 isoform X1 [Physcomitrium patens]XP_024398147.1 probable xyloglucan endotransglucosylase/hydrolase protein 5 isoform X1 [Physcomitrium patens]XP_024398149.1 probable xyloglucan endotransglucosylase/hydrolase protein 5|eukprot:XP_024398144.1 probable xyloglucan endotransglucosylase/hydrolase protein 5 isoform X1 [Physcomitrella patens]
MSEANVKLVGVVWRWWTPHVMCVIWTMAMNMITVLGQGTGSLTGAVTFLENYESQSDSQHFRILNDGHQVQLVLDEYAASGFGSKYQYLFGKIGMRMKLVPGNSAGTVTAYYMSSQTPGLHDEMDFEFLGNVTGQPYILQTNIYANGEGKREQRIYLWFDPTSDFHSYSVLWNTQQIVFYVDNTPIRVFKNNKDIGVPYPDSKPVGIYSTIWNGENWATNDGWVKLNWTYAPFVATYESFNVDACRVDNGDTASCMAQTSSWWMSSEYQTLGAYQVNQLEWVRNNYLLYDYCADRKRSPAPPPECARNPL